jgi:hypothetical protein
MKQTNPIDFFLFSRDHCGEKAEVCGRLVVANSSRRFTELNCADMKFLDLVYRAYRESLVRPQGERLCAKNGHRGYW